MQSEYSIVRQDRFIQATRDSGYKGTESALSELIDNAIQAGAKRVTIKMITDGEELSSPGRLKTPKVLEMVIADNGRGMNAESLRRSLRFGDSDRFNDRFGLGRFGMGLPNASVSQCERVEVYSWQAATERRKPLRTFIDVDGISKGQLEEVPPPEYSSIPAPYDDVIDGNSGTIVAWQRCDRLDHGGKLDVLERSLRHSLGRIFRHFLLSDLEITINGKRIEPFDPLYLSPQARLPDDPVASRYGDTLKFSIPIPDLPDQTSVVEVVLSLLPEAWQVNADKKELQKRHVDTTTGFSIVRARREIDVIKSPYHAKHWTDTWYRAEIRFDPVLDEVFGVTHTKQHASIKKGTPIFEKLREAIIANIANLKDTIIARGKKAHTAQTIRAEEAIQRVVPRLKPVEELTAKSESKVVAEVREFVSQTSFDKSNEERRNLEERLSKFTVILEYESLPGAPFYRTKVVGRSIVVLLNTAHGFYERVYRRIENESPLGKTGVDLLLMAIARSEAVSGDDTRIWYDDQRQEWSQHMKAFVDQLEEPEEGEGQTSGIEDSQPLKESSSANRELIGFGIDPQFVWAQNPTERYLAALSWCAKNHPDKFPQICERVRGRTRLYFSLDAGAIEESGISTKPEKVPGTSYWASTNHSTENKKEILIQVLVVVLGYGDAVARRSVASLGS